MELVDYDWPEEEVDPRSGVVRVHAKTRKEFDELTSIDPPFDSAYVYVGRPHTRSDVLITRGFSRVVMIYEPPGLVKYGQISISQRIRLTKRVVL